jgi:hypothetical protein
MIAYCIYFGVDLLTTGVACSLEHLRGVIKKAFHNEDPFEKKDLGKYVDLIKNDSEIERIVISNKEHELYPTLVIWKGA